MEGCGNLARDFWNDISPNYPPGYHMVIHDSKRQQVEEALSRMINPTERVVNLLCGVYAHIHSHLGIDIAPNLLNANNDLEDRLEWDLNSSSSPLPIPDGAFDTAVMISGIAYLMPPDYTFGEVHRILKLGGKFIIGYDISQAGQNNDEWRKMQYKQRLFYLQALFTRFGFGEQQVEVVAKDWEFPFFLVTSEKL